MAVSSVYYYLPVIIIGQNCGAVITVILEGEHIVLTSQMFVTNCIVHSRLIVPPTGFSLGFGILVVHCIYIYTSNKKHLKCNKM